LRGEWRSLDRSSSVMFAYREHAECPLRTWEVTDNRAATVGAQSDILLTLQIALAGNGCRQVPSRALTTPPRRIIGTIIAEKATGEVAF
jgi:hypothetical protein